jgi:hypothetical protein
MAVTAPHWNCVTLLFWALNLASVPRIILLPSRINRYQHTCIKHCLDIDRRRKYVGTTVNEVKLTAKTEQSDQQKCEWCIIIYAPHYTGPWHHLSSQINHHLHLANLRWKIHAKILVPPHILPPPHVPATTPSRPWARSWVMEEAAVSVLGDPTQFARTLIYEWDWYCMAMDR